MLVFVFSVLPVDVGTAGILSLMLNSPRIFCGSENDEKIKKEVTDFHLT